MGVCRRHFQTGFFFFENEETNSDAENNLFPAALEPATPSSAITDAAISRRRPSLNGGTIDGSLRVFNGESYTVNSQFRLTSDLYTVGTPNITVNSGASHGGVINDGGNVQPTGYGITLNSGAILPGKIHIRADALALPSDIPSSVPNPSGTRSVNINSPSDLNNIGNWATVRDLNVNPANQTINVPPGNYGTFTMNGTNIRLVFSAGTYNFNGTINLNGGSNVQSNGVVTINIGQNLNVNNGSYILGTNTVPSDVRLNVVGSSFTIDNGSQINALVRAINANVNINNGIIRGQLIANYLNINNGQIIGAATVSDTTPPTLNITSPANNAITQSAATNVNGTAADAGTPASGITGVTVNGAAASYNSSNGTWSFANLNLALGSNVITARATDGAGNITTQSITVTRQLPPDTTPPTVSITSPANNTVVPNSTVTVTGTAADTGAGATGINRVVVNGQNAVYNNNTGQWTISGVSLSEGTNTIRAIAYDNAPTPNTSETSIVVTRRTPDTQAPSIQITSPANNSDTYESTITISGTVIDEGVNASGVQRITVNGQEAAYNPTTNQWSAASIALAIGDNIFTVIAYDNAPTPNQSQATLRVIRREIPPPTVAITSPANNSTTTDASITVAATASANGPNSNQILRVTINGYDAVYNTANGTWTYNNLPLVTGTNIITARAIDSGGREASAQISVIRNTSNQPPTVNAGADQTITLPITANLSGVATDDGLPNNSLNISWSKVSGTGTVTFANVNSPNTTAIFGQTGTYVLRLTATDGQLTTSDEVTITVNPANQPPTVNAGEDKVVILPNKSFQFIQNNLEQFNQLASNPSIAGDFNGIPTGTDITGTSYNGMLFETGNNPASSAPLIVVKASETYTPSGFSGVIDANTNKLPASIGENVLSPGGLELAPGPNPLKENDDLKVTFAEPVAAVGFDILFQEYDVYSAVAITIYDPQGIILYQNGNLPVSTGAGGGAPGGKEFFGFVSRRSNIKTIVIDESDGNNVFPDSNIGFGSFRVKKVLPDTSVNLNGSVSDDGLPSGILNTNWSKVSGAGTVTFSDTNSPTTPVTFSEAGTYVLRLTANDTELESSDEVTVTAYDNGQQPANQPPTVNVGSDRTIILPNSANLSAIVKDDGLPTGSSVSVNWSKTSGLGNVTFSAPNSNSTQASFNQTGTYILRLTATDTDKTAFDEVTVTVLDASAVNQPPIVNAGNDATIALNNSLTLNGVATDDGLPNNSLTAQWSKISGAGNAAFSNPNNPQTTVSFSAEGIYVLRLTATDGQLSSSDDVTVTVNPAQPNQPPTVDAGADKNITIKENLLQNGSAEASLINGELPNWSEVRGTNWTRVQGEQNGAPAARFGEYIFSAGDAAQGELRQDVDIRPFAEGINAGTQSFEWKAYLRSALEQNADSGRIIFEYRDATNQNTIASLDSGEIASINDWQLTEDTRVPPAGTSFIRIRLLATRNTGATTDVFFDGLSLKAVGGGAAVKLNGAATDDGLPTGSTLQKTWTRISGGENVVFGNASAVDSSASFGTAGTYILRLTATDGQLSTSDEMTVTVNAANQTPTVNAGIDRTITLPATAQLNGTGADDGGNLRYRWTKVSGAGLVSFSDAKALNPTVTFSLAGTYVLRLTAEDGELETSDDIIVMVNPSPTNQPPTVEAGNNQTVVLPTNSVTLNGTVTDDGLPNNNLTIVWTKTSGNGNVAFANPNSATTTATFDASGSYVLRLTASDGNYTVGDEVAIIVSPQGGQNQPPTVNAGADQIITVSQTAILEAQVTDDGLPQGGSFSAQWTKVSGDGDVTFSNSTQTATYANFSAIGTYILRLTVSDSELSASDDVTITVAPNQSAPTVEILTPDDGGSLTEPTQISGTVSSGNWKLESSLTDTDNLNNRVWTTFATGTGAATGNLGNLDTTLMLNGLYDVRLMTTDQFGQISADTISVSIENNLKVGHFTVSFEDMNVPVAGIPIQIIRSYDSRDKRKGDFGFGWTLGIKNVRVEKNNVLGLKWRQTSNGAAFPTYCVEATRPHIVTVTMPDGAVEKFEARLQQMCQQFAPLTNGYVTFAAQNGTRGRLEVVGDNYVQIAGSVPGPVEFIGFDGNGIFDRTQFRYTAKDGTEFIINQNGVLQSVKDLDNNTLTISAAGILHSSGVGIAFTRDAQGRITQVTDPKGVSNTYTYDAAGDLISYKDRANNTTSFTYEPTIAHHLKSIIDPLNRTPIRNEYDASGRLLKHTDASGNEINYIHNLAARVETITDRLGNQTTFNYDSRGNVLQQTNALGSTTNFTYDGNDNVLTETNALGKTTTSIYDQFDNRTSVTDALGNRTEFTYNNLGQVLTVKDARNNLTTNTFDANGRLLKTTDAQNNETTYGYSLQTGQRTLQTDALGNQTRFEYFGNYLTKQIDAQNNETIFSYDANGNRSSQAVSRTLPNGQTETITTAFEYDNLNRLTKTTLADGTLTRTEYNSLGQQSTTIDQAGRRTEFDYDTLGRLIKTTYADTKFEESTFDAEGRRLTSKDRAGRITSFEYDALGRLKKTIYADGTFTLTNYDAVGQVTSSIDARGNSTIYTYDDAGRRLTVKNALNQITSFAYDTNGNQSATTDALNRTTSSVYDSLNRKTRTNFADSTFTETTLDVLGRRVSEKDQAGKVTQFVYDSLGRLTKVKDALNQETIYGYNELGQQISQKDALNRETKFEYDKLGRRVKRILPIGQVETYSYASDGNLQNKTDFNGKTTSFAYDNMRRLLSKTPDASLNQPTVSFTYNDLGQRATMTDASGTTSYGYDNRNRLSSKQTPFGTLNYTYDESGSIKTLRSSNTNGVSVDYDYDSLSRLQTVKDNRLIGNQTTTYTYDAVGNLQSYSYPNQVTTSYAYNNLNRLMTLTVSNVVGGLASYQYSLGASGNRTQVVEGSGRVVNYAYDDLYRLTSETIANSTNNGVVSYGYDVVGNRLNRNSSVSAVPNQTSTFDANDRLNSDTYDANGNTKISNGKTYNYDFENKLTSTSDGITIVYDGDGNRVSKTVGGVTTNYLVDTNNLTGYAQVVEEIVSGQVTKQFTYGHDLISQRQGSVVNFYGYDGHGSVRNLTNNLGNITDTYAYDAFGNLIERTGTTENNYLYAREQHDPNLGFYYNRARYLNTDTGRFISQDSFEGNQFEPKSLHKYLYVSGNPINNTDPSGYEEATLAGGFAAFGVDSILNSISQLQSFVIAAAITCALELALTGTLNEIGVGVQPVTPCGSTGFTPNQMRVQLQIGTTNVDSIPISAPPQRGVTVVQIERALEILFLRARDLIPNNLESEFLGAIARTSIGLRGIPPSGIIQGGNIWRETFNGYRVDTENLRGHNLRYIY